jgi:hypothetical protein
MRGSEKWKKRRKKEKTANLKCNQKCKIHIICHKLEEKSLF